MPSELTLYRDLLTEIKGRVRQAQHKAALSSNAHMTLMYWDIGRTIAARQEQEGWGTSIIPRLSADLKNELPEEKGFSARNLGYMIRFAREYGVPPILQRPAAKFGAQPAPLTEAIALETLVLQQPAAKSESLSDQGGQIACLLTIPWFHNVILIEKVKDLPTRLWYARQTLEHGWSRETLTVQIKNRAHERQGAAVTNFTTTLPTVHASLAAGLLKDPYLFDFLTLEEPFHEREIETGLLSHIQKFLLELGRGFAFVGRQYHLTVSDRDFYLDLLFYHLHLRCFVVVDLKKGDFKPEHAGKMNFYCSVVDDQLRHPQDQPTIGLILCQTKDRILAEYALRDIHKPIGIADYEFSRALPAEFASSLPSIESIEAELAEDLGLP
ncbi:MAG TPA: PDDEXK nuclease domain-containing protein [Prosthecobacter sp.]|nr:PDDEXK nuclease domain-containing protein [Prosthecobacter sp.]